MNMKILPSELGGKIAAIPSKSHAHRALICAALSNDTTFIDCCGSSEDIDATAECLAALGADVQTDDGGFSVSRRGGKVTEPYKLRCNESGCTFRFLLPVVGALGKRANFFMHGRLPQRPLSPLYEELSRHGCALSPQGSNPFGISRQLTPGEFVLDGNVSSQFISGLLFALPLLGEDSEIRITGRMESAGYVLMTMTVLKEFGIKAAFKDNVFFVPGKQKYRSPGILRIEGDWSNAAFWLCAGAVSDSPITVTGLDLESKQGDKAVLTVLAEYGAKIRKDGDSVTVSAGMNSVAGNCVEIDAVNIPDLVPILAVVGACSEGVTIIRNAARLRMKESDRIKTVVDMLLRFGAKAIEKEDGIEIHGQRAALKGGDILSHNDHRIAMAAAIAACTLKSGNTVIRGADAVNKSYPSFFEHLRKLGGKAESIGN
jgi:3-phosphoshikimate 1-carboxyvinyltransferase